MHAPTRSRRSLAVIVVAAMTLTLLPLMPAAAATCPVGSTSWSVGASGAWEVASNWSAGVPDATKDACIDVAGTYTVTATGVFNTAKTVTIANPDATLRLSGNSSVGDAVMTTAGGVTNEGLVELTATANSWAGELRLSSGTLVNSGTIRAGVGEGAGTRRRLIAAATIDNSGVLDLDFTTHVHTGVSGLTNTGSIDIALGVDLAVFDLGGSPPTVANTSGTISHAGMWVQFGGLLDLAGGTVDVTGGGFGVIAGAVMLGDVALSGAPTFTLNDVDLTLADPTADVATFVLTSPFNTLTGNIASTQTMRLSGNSSVGNAVVTAATGFTNGGLIELTATANSWGGELRLTSGTLVNNGTIRAHVGAGTGTKARVIAAHTIDNTGTLDINFTTLLNTGVAGMTNTGSIDVASGVTLTVDDLGGSQPKVANTSGTITHAGTWTHLGGLLDLAGGTVDATGGGFSMLAGAVMLGDVALSGAPTFTLNDVDLTLVDPTADVATFVLTSPFNTLTGNIASTQTMRLSGNSSVGNAVVTAATGFTNGGLIELTATANSWGGELRLTSGTLVNNGTIRAHVGAGTGTKARVIAAHTIDNTGTLDINFTTQVQTSGATLANSGVVDIADGVLLDVVGAFSQPAVGRVAVGVSSASNGVLDADSVSLDGTIEAVIDPTDLPADGVDYTVVTSSGRSGEFSNLDGSDLGDGRVLVMHHQPTAVILSTTEANQVPVNQAPVADAGGPYTVDEGGTVVLDGTGSTDPDGDTLSYQWELDGQTYDGATVTVPAPDASDTVTLTVTDPGAASDTDVATVTVNPVTVKPVPVPATADVGVVMSAAAGSVLVGGLLDFTLAVSNGGPDAATGVVVTDVLPAGLVFSASSEGCGADGQTVTCQVGIVPAGRSVDVTVTVAGTAVGEVTNTARVSTTVVDGNPGNDTSSVQVSVVAPEQVTERIFGLSRIETAVSASRSTYADGAAGAVVLARADTFPDALAGAPLAVANQAPLLLTGSDGLHPLAEQELVRVLPAGGTVHLLGGQAALSDAVADRVEQLGFATVRYLGADRYQTAVLIAQALGDPGAIFVATGTNFPDALTAGAAAAETGGVIVLTRGDQMVDSTAAFLDSHAGVPRFAVGGPAATADPGATPVFGTDRYATALEVAQEFFEAPAIVGVAVGSNFPDALSGGTHVARRRAPMLLVAKDTLPGPVGEYLAANRGSIGQVFVYGGDGAVSTDVEQAILAALQ